MEGKEGRSCTDIREVLSLIEPERAQLDICSRPVSIQQNDKQIMSHRVNHLGSDQLKVSTGVEAFWHEITTH